MPAGAPKGSKNAEGNRGNTKTGADRLLMKRVVDKSWGIIEEALDNPKTTNKERKYIAMEIVKRTAPKDVSLHDEDGILVALYKLSQNEK